MIQNIKHEIRKDIFPLRFYRNRVKVKFFFNIVYLNSMLSKYKIKYVKKYIKYDQLQLFQVFCKNRIVKNLLENPLIL